MTFPQTLGVKNKYSQLIMLFRVLN